MPFTLSHAVLAPPLAHLTGHRLPIAAIAIGCMVPDLIRLFVNDEGNTTHLWTSIIHPDLWLGLGFCVLWYLLYRPVIYRFIGIQHDLGIYGFVSMLKFLIGIIVAVIVGTTTHIIWDGLTHADFRTFAFKDFLSQSVILLDRSYPLHRVLQIGTSILAVPILLWMCFRYYQQHQQHFPVSPKIKYFAVILLLISLVVGCFSTWDYARYFSTEVWHSDLYYFVGKSINQFAQGALLVFTLGSLLFLFFDRDHRLG